MSISKKNFLVEVADCVKKTRETTPLTPSITNTVTINLVANAQLAAGGSAAMIYLPDEGEAMALAGGAFYINMGTQFPVYEETLPRTCKALFENKKTWVLDPVGLGIGGQRTKLISMMKEYKPSIVRGNASEIIAVAKLWGLLDEASSGGMKSDGARGVDSTDEVMDARDAAVAIAKYTGGAVAVSGKVDLVTDGEVVALCHGGSHFLPLITGAGCSLGGVCAVYAATSNPFIGALAATIVYNEAAKKAEKKSAGPGTFQQNFLDEIYLIEEKDILESEVEIL